MNGIHDMGGMHGMGPIHHEKNEPVFHERWEGRAFALNVATGDLVPPGVSGRFAIEQIPPAEYLRMSYYEKWLESLENILVKAGVVTRQEIANGKPAPGSPKAKPALTAAMVPEMVSGAPSHKNVQARPLFKVKQRVRARNMHPTGHTRLPRYARGKVGTIVRDHGVFAFEDTNASELQFEKPQHVYSVRFSARELWGEQASPHDAVYIDMWDDYLEHA
jgi:nitrile hydratase beta subunit